MSPKNGARTKMGVNSGMKDRIAVAGVGNTA